MQPRSDRPCRGSVVHRADSRRVESYYESFIGVLRAREDREECRSSSCTGELIASRSLTSRGRDGVPRLVKRRIFKACAPRGHAAEKIPRITTGPRMRVKSLLLDKEFFSSREYYCAQRSMKDDDHHASAAG